MRLAADAPIRIDPLADLGGGKGFIVDAALATTDALEWSNSGRGGFYPVVRRAEQRAAGHGGRRRGFDQQHASVEAGRLGAHLRAHRRARARRRRVVRAPAQGPRLRHAPARSWSSPSTAACPATTIDAPGRRAATSQIAARVRSITPLETRHPRLQRRGRREDSAVRRSQERRVHEDAAGDPQRLVSPAGRGQPDRAVSARYRRSRRPSPTRCGSASATGRSASRAAAEYCLKWIDMLQKHGGGVAGLALAERKGPRLRAVRRGARGVPEVPAGSDRDVESIGMAWFARKSDR